MLKNGSANPVTPAMAHGSKDAEGRLLGPSAATQRGYLQDRAPGAFRTDRSPVRSPMRRPATAPLVHTAPMRCEACTNASASGDVGYLAGFRQEGRHFWSMVDRSVPKGGSSSAPFSQPYTPFGRSRRLDGKGAS